MYGQAVAKHGLESIPRVVQVCEENQRRHYVKGYEYAFASSSY
jgi:hypothetical protein